MSNLAYLLGNAARELRAVERETARKHQSILDDATNVLHSQAVQLANMLADGDKPTRYDVETYVAARTEHLNVSDMFAGKISDAIALHVHNSAKQYPEILQAIYRAQDQGRYVAQSLADPIQPDSMTQQTIE